MISPNGRNAYVIGVADDKIAQYGINARTGALGSRPASSAATVPHPEALVLSANGRSAYVTCENDGRISQYKLSPTSGRITPLSPATVTTASGSVGLDVTPGLSPKLERRSRDERRGEMRRTPHS